jgi:hypothetical protein
MKDQRKNDETKSQDPLAQLDQIESYDTVLSKIEIKIVDNIFNNINDFYTLQENIRSALKDESLNKYQLLDFFDHVVNDALNDLNNEKKHKHRRGILFRMLFELPELLQDTIKSA